MSAIVSASHLVVGLFALWFLYFFCWREYRIDSFRQHLFGVRDDIFDFAASGGIAFDDPAYTTLRDLSNALIRFAHKLTFTRALVILLFGKLTTTDRMKDWKRDVESRPEEVRSKLLKAHDQIALATAHFVMAWSPLGWVCVLIAGTIGVLVSVFKLRLKVQVVRGSKGISNVLEQEALEQSSLVGEDGSYLAAV